MASQDIFKSFAALKAQLAGDFLYDDVSRLLYATDASSYRQVPQAVCYPRDNSDLKLLIDFACKHGTSLIPRTAGTSLAGQVVGGGIVVDFSRYLNKILEYNAEEGWVRVQPGVIRDDLNRYLKPYGVFFAPETSTANRAMIGGMIGNNSCGSNSVVYGSTREHLLEVKALLSDTTEITFGPLTQSEFEQKCHLQTTEGGLYRHINQLLSDPHIQQAIRQHYPNPDIHRRNTGYALDMLLHCAPFTAGGAPFNFCRLLAGSEGTLALVSEAKLKTTPLPPSRQALVCAHFNSIYDSLKATQIALKHRPSAVELMDHYILDATRNNITYSHYMFFVEGEPQAILVIELRDKEDEPLKERAAAVIADLQAAGLGYHYPVVWNEQARLVWELRKAGLGLLSNMPGDAKPVPVVEDTAVHIDDLPEYIREFNQILQKYGLSAVHYAHAGSGELHLRPIINLKTPEGNLLFRTIAEEVSRLVKKYNGSLSGEHGDGRLRGEFIPYMLGDEIYKLLKELKNVWDPQHVFNPGKIVDTPSMNSFLRYEPGHSTPEYTTRLDFESTLGIVRAAEQCNGSGDCRKSAAAGGVMCPSYMATGNEKHTTRARANIFREIAGREFAGNPFVSEEIKEVFDLCLLCKGCKAECPSNVDIGKIKTEFLYQYQKEKGLPWRTRLIGHYASLMQLAAPVPWLFNGLLRFKPTEWALKQVAGFAQQRSMPLLNKQTFSKWLGKQPAPPAGSKGTVWLFVDEFTNYNDLAAGIATVQTLTRLGYEVKVAGNVHSGRAYLSKGMLDEAARLVDRNIELLKDKVSEQTPLIGIEPSAILSFRDEYLDLASDREAARQLADNALLFEEFIDREIQDGHIDRTLFKPLDKAIKYHGHCHQKALSELSALENTLQLIPQATVEKIPSGCCGMAGSFGYEKEHYEVSMQIGELVLFPAVRAAGADTLIVAPGTSCRHQIKDGTGATALHPAEVLWLSLSQGD